MSNDTLRGTGEFLQTRSAIRIKSELEAESEYLISGSLLIEGRDEYFINQDELSKYVQGSEYFSDIFQKVIEENSRYDMLELLKASNRIRPLFEMLSIEKIRLQERGNDQGTKKADDRIAEIQTAKENQDSRGE